MRFAFTSGDSRGAILSLMYDHLLDPKPKPLLDGTGKYSCVVTSKCDMGPSTSATVTEYACPKESSITSRCTRHDSEVGIIGNCYLHRKLLCTCKIIVPCIVGVL
jgi:hypothetical protein